jgi:aminoglycoside 6'-N-acetyltransferase
MPAVEISAFDPGRDAPLLAAWVRRPHVAEWWGDPGKTLAAVARHPVADAALIRADGRPVGFACWQQLSRQELADAGLDELPAGLIDIDIMIGEPEALGLGCGPEALRQLLEKLRGEGVPIVGLAAETANHRALRAYEKSGFRPFRDFQSEGREMRYLVQALATPDER